jgi:hypothetical protein
LTNNAFGKRTLYITSLDIELRRAKELYPKLKVDGKDWSQKHHEAALIYYQDSFEDGAKFIEIGRLNDTARAKSEGGHVQSVDLGNWTPIANDCWMLGGFHSSKIFRLNTLGGDAVWDGSKPATKKASYAFPVPRRELTGLLEFGFRPISKSSTTIVFESTTPEKAFNATLAQYAETTTLAKRSSRMVNDFISDWLG